MRKQRVKCKKCGKIVVGKKSGMTTGATPAWLPQKHFTQCDGWGGLLELCSGRFIEGELLHV